MPAKPAAFHLHDVWQFPLCRLRPGPCMPGYARQWGDELLALMQLAHPFILVYPDFTGEETAPDRQYREQWLRHHGELLLRWCLALIVVRSGKKQADDASDANPRVQSSLQLFDGLALHLHHADSPYHATLISHRLAGMQPTLVRRNQTTASEWHNVG